MLEERTNPGMAQNKSVTGRNTGSKTILSNGANGTAGDSGDVPVSPPPVLPGYDIIGLLGRGGKGVVYKARQLHLNRLVAVKMILAGPHASVNDVARFMGEAEAVAHLHHPNIVQIYEVNQHEGLPYCVLEYVDGGSLQQKMRGAPVPPQKAAELIESVARAMHVAHVTGIVHRDLKPANVLLTRDGQPKITDFGLAKRLEPGNSLTGSGDVLGTPSYMAPEQADGMSGRVGPPSDVYALGAILYELLTGRPPFRGVTTMDTLRQVVSEEPVPPRRLQPKVPSDLETICLKSLAKEPTRRYATAEELADDLRRYLRHEPIHARPAGVAEKVGRWARRNPVAAAAIAATVLTVIGAFISLLFAWESESRQRLDAEAQRHNAELRLADNDLITGIKLCERGNLHAGLLWMARGLRHVPPTAGALERTIRANIPAWQGQIHQLEGIFQRPADDISLVPNPGAGRFRNAFAVNAVACSSDSKYVLTGGWSGPGARLWDLSTGDPVRAFPHDVTVFAVAISPDGRYVLTGSRRKFAAALWDLHTGQELRTFPHSSPVFAVAFSPDGKQVLTGSSLGEVFLWDVETGQQRASFPHDYPVRSVAFHPNGRLFATASGGQTAGRSGDRTARIWDIATRKEVAPPLPHRDAVHAVAFSPNGKTIATACGDKAAYLWSASNYAPLGQPLWHDDEVLSVCFSPDGKTIVTGSRDKTARVWDVSTLKPRGAPLLHQDEVTAVTFVADGTGVVVGCRDGLARRWRINGDRPPRPALLHEDNVLAVAFSPDDRIVATGCGDGNLSLWDAGTGKWLETKTDHKRAITSVRFSPDSNIVLTSSEDHTARLWDSRSGKPIRVLQHEAELRATVFSPDGKFIGSGCQDGKAYLWETETGRLLWSAEQRSPVRALAFSADSGVVFTGCENGQVAMWQSATGMTNGSALDHETGVEALAVGGDGRTLVTGCKDGRVWLWDLTAMKSKELSPSHKASVHIVAITTAGDTILTCSQDGVARLWSSADGEPIGPPLQHQPAVHTAVFSPDGTLVLIGSQDGKAYVWSAQTGKPVGPPIVHKGWVTAVAFNSTGQIILTGSSDKTARLWELSKPIQGEARFVELELAVLLGAELDDTGGLNFLTAEEWKDRCRQWNDLVKR
jgi:WD40 repeat protein